MLHPSSDDTAHPLILTCEHATHEIPAEYQDLFRGANALLRSHQGWDPGAYEAALAFRDHFGCQIIAGEASRLLVELNRSLEHPRLWSIHTGGLSWVRKERILRTFYHSYREKVQGAIREMVARGKPVTHLSVHSLVPCLDGQERAFEVALLFDPGRPLEVALCKAWKRHLKSCNPDLRVVFNTPYKGTDDGLTTALRQTFSAERYLGIEIEFNQALLERPRIWRRIQRDAAETLAIALDKVSVAGLTKKGA